MTFWHPDKLASLVAGLGGAQLVYSDQRLVTADGGLISETYWSSRRNNHTNFASLLIANTVTGAASLFRRGVLERALPFPEVPGEQYHDHWLALVAMAIGDHRLRRPAALRLRPARGCRPRPRCGQCRADEPGLAAARPQALARDPGRLGFRLLRRLPAPEGTGPDRARALRQRYGSDRRRTLERFIRSDRTVIGRSALARPAPAAPADRPQRDARRRAGAGPRHPLPPPCRRQAPVARFGDPDREAGCGELRPKTKSRRRCARRSRRSSRWFRRPSPGGSTC